MPVTTRSKSKQVQVDEPDVKCNESSHLLYQSRKSQLKKCKKQVENQNAYYELLLAESYILSARASQYIYLLSLNVICNEYSHVFSTYEKMDSDYEFMLDELKEMDAPTSEMETSLTSLSVLLTILKNAITEYTSKK